MKGGEMKLRSLVALCVCLLAAAAYAGSVVAASSGVTTRQLAKSQFEAFDVSAHSMPARLWRARIRTQGRSDAYLIDNTFAPGGTTGWHSHPGPSLIFVVAGTITNYTADDASCGGHAYAAGSGFIDAGGDDVHMLRNDGAAPAETIAMQLLPSGADRKVDKPDPPGCRR
jgi:quercetin dioxygenase-like cupin family protein